MIVERLLQRKSEMNGRDLSPDGCIFVRRSVLREEPCTDPYARFCGQTGAAASSDPIFLVHALWLLTSPPAFIGGGNPGLGVLYDQLTLKLIECYRHVKEQPPFRCGCVDVLREDFKADAAIMDVRDGLVHLCQGTSQPREFPNDEPVSLS